MLTCDHQTGCRVQVLPIRSFMIIPIRNILARFVIISVAVLNLDSTCIIISVRPLFINIHKNILNITLGYISGIKIPKVMTDSKEYEIVSARLIW